MATKKAPAKKKASAKIRVTYDLGLVKATPEQETRLRAYIHNTVITWVKSDLKNPSPIYCADKPGGGGGGGNGGDGKGGDGGGNG